MQHLCLVQIWKQLCRQEQSEFDLNLEITFNNITSLI